MLQCFQYKQRFARCNMSAEFSWGIDCNNVNVLREYRRNRMTHVGAKPKYVIVENIITIL